MEKEKPAEHQIASLVYKLGDPCESKGHLFLGGKEAASDMSFIHANNIKAVLSVASIDSIKYENQEISHLVIDAYDTTTYNIRKDFQPSQDFIDFHLQHGNVLVHCEQGISRSPTIVIAYIMQKEKRLFSDVLHKVKKTRKQVNPNGGFYFHLDKYGEHLRHEYHE